MAVILPAYAKLNLTLDVTGRRPNGYHDVDSVMQTISLHDLIWVERTECRVFDIIAIASCLEIREARPWPNPQGGANGRQPFISDTNRTPAAAASRRSP